MPITITLTAAEARATLEEIEVAIECIQKYAASRDIRKNAKAAANDTIWNLWIVRCKLMSASK